MVVELDDTSKVKKLFEGWQETLIEDVYPNARKVTRYAIKKDACMYSILKTEWTGIS